MTPKNARPQLLHHFMLLCLQAWKQELQFIGRIGHAKYDAASRLRPLVFLASEQLRRDVSSEEPVVPMDVHLLDWHAFPATDFFRSPTLERATNWLVHQEALRLDFAESPNYQLQTPGKVIMSAVRLRLDLGDFSRSGGELMQSHIDEAIGVTIAKTTKLDTIDFRDYFLAYSFQLFNEGVMHAYVDYSDRYKYVERSSSDRARAVGERHRLYS